MDFVVSAHAVTDIGLRRRINEDDFLINEQVKLFVVADGMGGHAAGDIASRFAVRCIQDFYVQSCNTESYAWPYGYDMDLSEEGNALSNAVKEANTRIRELAQKSVSLAGMGTTVVLLLATDRRVTIANVGDSRCYVFRSDGFTQLTDDHSWVNEQIKQNLISKDDARAHPWRNVVTRALGSKDDVEVDIFEEKILPGDYFLLCSDGLTNFVAEIVLFETIMDPTITIEEKCQRIVNEAKAKGSTDNITALLVRFDMSK